METNILIKWLDDIDHKLKNKKYKKENALIGSLNGDEKSDLWSKKMEIVLILFIKGIIEYEEYKKYFVAEENAFLDTPIRFMKKSLNSMD